jgi:uncharacterized membrane protein
MELYKKFIAKDNEKLIRIIPIIACAVGIIAGITCFYVFPTIIVATNVGTATLVGGASGLSATGCNQIFKQLAKFGIDVKETEVETDETTDKETDNTKK